MNFADNILSLARVMFYSAPAEHSPTPFVIPENTHIIEMLTGGVVFFGDGDEKRAYRRGTIFWHVPGDKTIFDTTRDEPYRCIVFRFAAKSAERIAPRVSSWRGSSEALDDFIRQSHSAFFATGDSPEQAKTVSAYCLGELLMHALSLKNMDGKSMIGQTPQANEVILRNILMYIENNLADDLSSYTLAEKFKLPRNKLFALFSKFMNTSLQGYITGKRFDQARLLLESSNMPIKEVAALCGFEHVEVFHRSFAKRFGCTPKNYRLNALPYIDLKKS
ncbi:MAG: helix-turn-helix domain-containing protein [Lentisphaerae bacterium]|nr:helix-turn-helix domain-containing protein [Lentisphaerota bacterium]